MTLETVLTALVVAIAAYCLIGSVRKLVGRDDFTSFRPRGWNRRLYTIYVALLVLGVIFDVFGIATVIMGLSLWFDLILVITITVAAIIFYHLAVNRTTVDESKALAFLGLPLTAVWLIPIIKVVHLVL